MKQAFMDFTDPVKPVIAEHDFVNKTDWLERREKAVRIRNKGISWRGRNAEGWAWMESRALELAAQGKHFSAWPLIIELRMSGVRLNEGEDGYRITHDVEPLISRWLVLEHPELAEYVVVGKSCLDLLTDEELAYNRS